MELFSGNNAAISIVHNLVHRDRTKHVEIDQHYIKEKIEDGVICMNYMPTKQQITDVLTKGLPRQGFEVRMINIYSTA